MPSSRAAPVSEDVASFGLTAAALRDFKVQQVGTVQSKRPETP